MEDKKKKDKSLKFNEKLIVNGSFNDVLQVIAVAANKKLKQQKLSVSEKN